VLSPLQISFPYDENSSAHEQACVHYIIFLRGSRGSHKSHSSQSRQSCFLPIESPTIAEQSVHRVIPRVCCVRCYTCIIMYYAARITFMLADIPSPECCVLQSCPHMNPSCTGTCISFTCPRRRLCVDILEAIDGRLQVRPAPASPINTLRTIRYLVPTMHGNAANAHANNPPLNLSHMYIVGMHHRHIHHALTSRTRLWRPRTKFCSIHMQMLSFCVVSAVLNPSPGQPTSSHTDICTPLEHSAVSSRASKHHRNVTRHTRTQT